MNFVPQKTLKNPIFNYDPIEKIIPKINFDILKKKFCCNICSNTEEKLYILSCCGETLCEKCKNKMQLTQEICKFCDEKPLLFMPNNPVGEFKERIINIIQKKQAETELIKLNMANQLNTSTVANANLGKVGSIDDKINEKLKNITNENVGYNMNSLNSGIQQTSNMNQMQNYMNTTNRMQGYSIGYGIFLKNLYF